MQVVWLVAAVVAVGVVCRVRAPFGRRRLRRLRRIVADVGAGLFDQVETID